MLAALETSIHAALTQPLQSQGIRAHMSLYVGVVQHLVLLHSWKHASSCKVNLYHSVCVLLPLVRAKWAAIAGVAGDGVAATMATPAAVVPCLRSADQVGTAGALASSATRAGEIWC